MQNINGETMTELFIRNPKLLKRDKAGLLIIDIQERLFPVITGNNLLLENVLKLLKGINVLSIPVFYTEQYSKGLGDTLKVIKDELVETSALQKMTFSCSGSTELMDEIRKAKVSQLIICGVEAHVCVQQTVLDFLANGFFVSVPADAISSRKIIDYEISLSRMRDAGADITTVEAILFELLEVCGTPEFKAVSKIVK